MCSADVQIQRRTGLSAHEHRKRGMELLFPNRIWHPWREERMQSVQHCLERRTQELSWIGSSNSNKTGDAADTAVTLWLTKPENTTIYIASPFESATETGVWAEIQGQFNIAKEHNAGLPGKVRHSDNSIVLYQNNPRSFIRVTTVDAVGKLVGKKSVRQDEGLIILILDELPAFTASATVALFKVLPNLISNQNLLIIGTGNFANPWDALGIFTDPDERDIPGGFDGFDPDRHFRWRTKRGGLCLRFDGLQSPNVKAGSDIYPFLTTNAYIAKLAAAPGGLLSPDSMRFIRSAPCNSLDEFKVTNPERIRAGGCYDEYEWTADTVLLGAYIDPGFGGDPCVLQKFKLGYMKTVDGKRRVVSLWEEPVTIPIKIGLKDADGVEIPIEKQIVNASRAHCEQHRIPEAHIGFDGSLRAGIVQAFSAWSLKLHAIDSQGPPTSRRVSMTEIHDKKDSSEEDKPVLWKEKVDRLLSEFWMSAALIIDSGQLRGLQLSPKAIRQLTTRRWAWTGGRKRKVETKKEYKENLAKAGQPAESPNEADTVVGCLEIARRMGLMPQGLIIQGGSVELLLEMLKNRRLEAAQRTLNGQISLKSGELHAMRSVKRSLPSGKLHRRP